MASLLIGELKKSRPLLKVIGTCRWTGYDFAGHQILSKAMGNSGKSNGKFGKKQWKFGQKQ